MVVCPEALQVLSTPAIIQTTRDAPGVLQYPVATASKWSSLSFTLKLIMICWRYMTDRLVWVQRSQLWVVTTPRVLFISPLERRCGLNSRRTVATQEEGSMPTTRPFMVQVCERNLSRKFLATVNVSPASTLKIGTSRKEILWYDPRHYGHQLKSPYWKHQKHWYRMR